MKRLVTLALVALLATSASAVEWREVSDYSTGGEATITPFSDYYGRFLLYNGSSADVAAIITYDANSALGSGTVFGITGTSFQGIWLSLSSDGTYTLNLRRGYNGTSTTDPANPYYTFSTKATAGGSDVIVFQGKRISETTITWVVTVNGESYSMDVYYRETSSGAYAIQWGTGAVSSMIGSDPYDGTLHASVIATSLQEDQGITVAQATAALGELIPEPTALALLALCVAGLTLRRKAA